MSTLAHRLTAMAAVTQRPRRVPFMPLAAIAAAVALAGGSAYAKLPQTASGFGKQLIAQVSSDRAALDRRWGATRQGTGDGHRTGGRVECIGNYDPYWEAQEIANRIQAGERVFVGCLQVRIAVD
jgi:outer membrane murein-binding lipoprotein Lpp